MADTKLLGRLQRPLVPEKKTTIEQTIFSQIIPGGTLGSKKSLSFDIGMTGCIDCKQMTSVAENMIQETFTVDAGQLDVLSESASGTITVSGGKLVMKSRVSGSGRSGYIARFAYANKRQASTLVWSGSTGAPISGPAVRIKAGSTWDNFTGYAALYRPGAKLIDLVRYQNEPLSAMPAAILRANMDVTSLGYFPSGIQAGDKITLDYFLYGLTYADQIAGIRILINGYLLATYFDNFPSPLPIENSGVGAAVVATSSGTDDTAEYTDYAGGERGSETRKVSASSPYVFCGDPPSWQSYDKQDVFLGRSYVPEKFTVRSRIDNEPICGFIALKLWNWKYGSGAPYPWGGDTDGSSQIGDMTFDGAPIGTPRVGLAINIHPDSTWDNFTGHVLLYDATDDKLKLVSFVNQSLLTLSGTVHDSIAVSTPIKGILMDFAGLWINPVDSPGFHPGECDIWSGLMGSVDLPNAHYYLSTIPYANPGAAHEPWAGIVVVGTQSGNYEDKIALSEYIWGV